MYEITRAQMLLTTAVFAAVAAVCAGGASARIPEDGSGIGAAPVAVVAPPQERGTFSVEEICAALDLEQTRGVLINEQAIKAASPGAIQECSHAATRAEKPIVPVLRYNSRTGTGQQVARYSRTAPARLRAAQAKFCANTKLIHDRNEEALDQGWSQDAMVALFQSEIVAKRRGCAWVQFLR
jgi:hypothetical protein